MPQPQPVREICAKREEIAQSIRDVMTRILDLHVAKIEVLKEGDLHRLKRIGDEIGEAAALETALLERFEAHINSHGCQPPKALQ